MDKPLTGYLICAAIIAFGVVYHLGAWVRSKRPPHSLSKRS